VATGGATQLHWRESASSRRRHRHRLLVHAYDPFNVGIFGPGLGGSARFALAIWGAISLPIIVESALFIRLHPLVVIGQLLDWLTTSLAASLATGWWLTR